MKESVRMVVALALVAIASAVVLSFVNNFTYEHIQSNRARVLHGSIFAVLPGAVDVKVIEVGPQNIFDDDRSTLRNKPDSDSDPLLLYQGLDEQGDPVGFAYVGEAAGYGGIVKIMVGVDHNTELISGLAVWNMRKRLIWAARLKMKASGNNLSAKDLMIRLLLDKI